MFKNRNRNGFNNVSGKKIAQLRKRLKLSQRALADEMQLIGLDVGKNTIQQIECGKRFVTDIELKYFSHFFHIEMDDLVDYDIEYDNINLAPNKIAED